MSTVATASYRGADVDGLDHLAQEFQQAAQVCDEVKAACEIIVAASFIFGPFGAAFVSYLKTVVIPWLTKISEALKLMAKVLSAHSNAQRDASSSATSLPSYSTPPSLPTGNTANYPVLPPAAGTGAGGTGSTTPTPVSGSGSSGSSVSTPPAIGGSSAVPTTPTTPATTPTGSSPASPVPTTPGSLGGTGGLGSTAGLGNLPPGVTATPLHPGDAVGYMTVPVEIGKDGTITPLLHVTAPATTPTTTPTTPATPHAPAVPAPAVTHHPGHPVAHHGSHHVSSALGSGGSGGGSGSGSGGGGLGGGGLTSGSSAHGTTPHGTAAQYVSATPPTIGAHPATASAGAGAQPGPAAGASHDGLYGGIGQATGIGAGAAALARATLHEARQRSENGLLGAVTLPFDADADTAVRATVLNGELQ